MTDREYMDTLVRRVREKANSLQAAVKAPPSSDGKSAPHVSQDQLRKAAVIARDIIKIYEASA